MSARGPVEVLSLAVGAEADIASVLSVLRRRVADGPLWVLVIDRPGAGIVDHLVGLAQLHLDGVLTLSEFMIAKRRVVEPPGEGDDGMQDQQSRPDSR
ncbi:hypothetical protein [Paractinoplanes lichenicola]|uniref:Uncharacterized protein n=1 Tax=Paractinoplanes lichenicola TaxID=2802976 RepID=A0ABS1W018_9ACTN|nr:hypothetical protein [Actinoplanes lichenicola]MBL7260074.1 hypothetical protein [Actinoplanes lichenicola]